MQYLILIRNVPTTILMMRAIFHKYTIWGAKVLTNYNLSRKINLPEPCHSNYYFADFLVLIASAGEAMQDFLGDLTQQILKPAVNHKSKNNRCFVLISTSWQEESLVKKNKFQTISRKLDLFQQSED